MGRLIYGAGAMEFEFEDRTLSHVKIAITTKLRRHEAFLVSWEVPLEKGSGRVSLWISREVPLAFLFDGSRPPRLNERWMEALLVTSHRTGGMYIMAEEDTEAYRGA